MPTQTPATPRRAAKHGTLSEATKELLRLILDVCPDCQDREAAIQAVREARLWGNSAIVLEGLI